MRPAPDTLDAPDAAPRVASRRILLSYPSELDEGEGIHYARVLRRLGHRVHEVNVTSTSRRGTAGRRLIRGYPSDVTLEALLDEVGGADLFLYLEPWGVLPRGLESSPIPTACVLSDTHRNPAARRMVGRLFDHVIVYHRNHVRAHHGRAPGTAHWIPYASDLDVVHDLGVERDLDVAFVGRLYTGERRRIVEALSARYRVNLPRSYRQDEIPGIYSRAKIVIDLPPGDYIAFRVFEAMSCGALLLTRRMPSGIEELFTEGEHYEAFGSERELLDKVDALLQDDARRRRIASQGHAEVRRRHTLEQRVTQILEAAGGEPRFRAPIRSMSRREVDGLYGRAYERMGRVDSLLSLAATAPDRRSALAWRWYAGRAFARRMLLRW